MFSFIFIYFETNLLLLWLLVQFYKVHLDFHCISTFDYLKKFNITCRHDDFTVHSFTKLIDDAVGKNLFLEAWLLILLYDGN